ncbi:MAG TPA: hypothetical protein PL033_05090 [Candidatus Brocadiia bacterium]|nr:hypothetical protein [Candidatus Brocadiia bacterium]
MNRTAIGRTRGTALAALILLALAFAGCSSPAIIRVDAPDDAATSRSIVLVVSQKPPEEYSTGVIYSVTDNPLAEGMLATFARKSLEKTGRYAVKRPEDTAQPSEKDKKGDDKKDAGQDQKKPVDSAIVNDPAKLEQLGRELGIEAVIVAHVHQCSYWSLFFIQRARVNFDIKCVACSTSKELWYLRYEEKRWFTDELELLREGCDLLIGELDKRMTANPQ